MQIWRKRFAGERHRKVVEERFASPGGGKAIADVLGEHYRARRPQPKSDRPIPENGIGRGGAFGGAGADDGERQGDQDTDAFVDFVLTEMEVGVPRAPVRPAAA